MKNIVKNERINLLLLLLLLSPILNKNQFLLTSSDLAPPQDR
jgi:hypothetical protein